jgi:hypothetical protein
MSAPPVWLCCSRSGEELRDETDLVLSHDFADQPVMFVAGDGVAAGSRRIIALRREGAISARL